MKITKYVHSCLVVEDDGYLAIVDPGQFSWQSNLFNVETLSRLDDIVITHEHFDHMHTPFIQALRSKFPQARITTTQAAAQLLKEAGVAGATTAGEGAVELFAAKHEPLAPLGQPPEHTGVNVLGRLTHPGDCHHFTETKEILALPVTAPWGSLVNAAALGLELGPKYIIPIHDWHWNDTARQQSYERLAQFYQPHGITFIKPQDGVAFEV